MAMDSVVRRMGRAVATTVLAMFCAAIPSHAQATPDVGQQSASGSAGATRSHLAKRPVHGRKAKPEPQAAVEPPHPPDPPPPDWPVNDKAVPASIQWNGRELKIDAANASLGQILHDVSTATGVEVEGIGSGAGDQRVYGSYGPASARDVLSQLLDGSGYNVLMLGDQGEGNPRELMLTTKTSGGPAQNQSANGQAGQSSSDDSADEPEPPEQPEQPEPGVRRPNGFPAPAPGETRQQMMQQMQQRQMQLEEQQREQQQMQQQAQPTPNQ